MVIAVRTLLYQCWFALKRSGQLKVILIAAVVATPVFTLQLFNQHVIK